MLIKKINFANKQTWTFAVTIVVVVSIIVFLVTVACIIKRFSHLNCKRLVICMSMLLHVRNVHLQMLLVKTLRWCLSHEKVEMSIIFWMDATITWSRMTGINSCKRTND